MLKDEQICHLNVMNWLRQIHPEAEENSYHFANERKCTIQQGRLLKRMGVKRGVADVFIGIPKQGKSGLWVEIKVEGNYPTKEQKDFLARQVKNGFAAACCWDLDACIRVIGNYLADEEIIGYFDEVIYQKSG